MFLKNLYWKIGKGTIKNPALPTSPDSFLFVCKGNICRGPFAAGMAEKLLAKQLHIRFGSAGLHVMRPAPSPSEAVLAAKQFEVDLGSHRSREIEFDMVKSYKMVLAMEAGQFRYLKKIFPLFQDKIFLLPLFEPDHQPGVDRYTDFNIEDPYEKSMDVFLECYTRIKICLEGLFEQVYK